MANSVSGCGQDLDRLQHVAILGVNLCGLEGPAKLHQQLDARFFQIVILQEL